LEGCTRTPSAWPQPAGPHPSQLRRDKPEI
jgi:hypothetical protein